MIDFRLSADKLVGDGEHARRRGTKTWPGIPAGSGQERIRGIAVRKSFTLTDTDRFGYRAFARIFPALFDNRIIITGMARIPAGS
jgi:hypothetical protein